MDIKFDGEIGNIHKSPPADQHMDMEQPNCTNYALPGKRDFQWRCTNWHLPYIWIHEYSTSKLNQQMNSKTQTPTHSSSSKHQHQTVHIHVHATKLPMKGTTV